MAQLFKAGAVRAVTDAACPDKGFCHAAPRLCILHLNPKPHPPITFCEGTANKPLDGAGEGRDASSALGSDEAGDGGVDKATRAAIARTYGANRGGGGGESGLREAGEGEGRGGGGVGG